MERSKKDARVQLTAVIDRELKKELFKALIDEGITYREWLEKEILSYLKRRGKKR